MYRKLICLISFVLALSLAGIASAELVAYWPLDEGSGTTAVDVTGNGHDGTIGGTARWVTGKNNLALDFDGTSTYIDMDDEVVRGTWTLAMWLKPRDIPYTTDYYAVMHTDAWSAGTPHVHLRANTSLWNVDTNSGPNISSTTVLQEDEWYHCTYTVSNDGSSNTAQIYINGVLESEGQGGSVASYFGPLNFGAWTNNQRFYHGLMDDIRVYNHALSDTEVLSAMAGKVWPYASGPNPEDGALHADTWVSLSWKPGGLAVSHDVYFGDNFDEVNDGLGDTFRGNQGSVYFVAGFPGYPYPNGLVNGTTYYWRIDEVNDADPNSPWKGKVWSFSIPPTTAYNPSPADGSKFIDPAAVTLNWTAGFRAKLHTVYFGDNFDTVVNAAGGVPQGVTTYKPGVLEAEKTYYWRVDEFDASATHKGDVWSFVTARAGGGVKGQYYKGMNFESLVLTRTDPQINFNWGASAPDPVVGADLFSVRWTGEVEAAFTETYTFYTNSDDGIRLWIDGRQLVDNWTDHGTTENSGKIDLVAGNTYSLLMEFYENGGGAVAELRWSGPRTPKQLIPQAALSPPVKASASRPGNGATGTSLTPVLTWSPGDFAASHEVYFGTVADAVKNATKASPEYKGSKSLGDESYAPGKLAWFTTYYWRVDEVNNVHVDSPWVGNVWSFTTGDFLLIDDFEGYDAGANQIWYSWHDGLGYGAPGAPPYFAGNGTGAAVGDENTASYTEETIVRGGRQSMPVAYDNNKQGAAKYSEAELTLTAPRDWTEESVRELSLWFRGDAANAPERLYVAVSNAAGSPAVVVHDDSNAAKTAVWTEWVIPLQSFADKGINLTNVDKIAIGLGTRGNLTTPGGAGRMYFDDIRLVRPRTP
jgi:hypothetical protein